MTSTEKPPVVQPPRRQTLQLGNGVEMTITEGMFCPLCDGAIRVVDAEPLDHGDVRLICRCGYLVLQYGSGS
jgi:hypothetical protein